MLNLKHFNVTCPLMTYVETGSYNQLYNSLGNVRNNVFKYIYLT